MAHRYMLLTLALVAPFACDGGGPFVVEQTDESPEYNEEAARRSSEQQQRPSNDGEQPENAGQQPGPNPQGLDNRPDESPATGGRSGTGGSNGSGARPGTGGDDGTGAESGAGAPGTGTCPTDCSACEGVCLQCLCIAQGNTAACTSVCTPPTTD